MRSPEPSGQCEISKVSLGELSFVEENGGAPTTLANGSAPGESGLSAVNVRFLGGMQLAATLRQHLVCFQRMDGQGTLNAA